MSRLHITGPRGHPAVREGPADARRGHSLLQAGPFGTAPALALEERGWFLGWPPQHVNIQRRALGSEVSLESRRVTDRHACVSPRSYKVRCRESRDENNALRLQHNSPQNDRAGVRSGRTAEPSRTHPASRGCQCVGSLVSYKSLSLSRGWPWSGVVCADLHAIDM